MGVADYLDKTYDEYFTKESGALQLLKPLSGPLDEEFWNARVKARELLDANEKFYNELRQTYLPNEAQGAVSSARAAESHESGTGVMS